jgi:hypothetical protein
VRNKSAKLQVRLVSVILVFTEEMVQLFIIMIFLIQSKAQGRSKISLVELLK